MTLEAIKKGLRSQDINLIAVVLRNRFNQVALLPLNENRYDLPIDRVSIQNIMPEDVILRNFIKEQCGLGVDFLKVKKAFRSHKSKDVFIIVFEGYASINSIIDSDMKSYEWVNNEQVLMQSALLKHLSPEELEQILPSEDQITPWELYDTNDALINIVLGRSAVSTIREYNRSNQHTKVIYAIPSSRKDGEEGVRFLRYFEH